MKPFIVVLSVTLGAFGLAWLIGSKPKKLLKK